MCLRGAVWSGRPSYVTRVQLADPEWEFIEPYLPIGEYGPYPERLRQQFEGVIWRFKTGGQWREMPAEFGAWSTVHNRFRQWRDAGVFEALLEGLITEAAKRGEVDLSLVSVDSTTARAHHDAAGMHLDEDVVTALEKAAAEEEKARSKGAASRNKAGRRPKAIPRGKNDDASGVGTNSG
jgi:transposase